MNFKLISSFVLILTSFLIISCNNGDSQENTGDSLQTPTLSDQGENMATVTPDTINADTRTMIESLHSEIALQINMAKLAMENSDKEAIKNLGKTIVDQQTELNNKLKDIASEKNIEFPTTLNPGMESILETYKSKKGAAFSDSYLDWVVKSTEANINLFEKEGPAVELNELQQFVKNAIPIFIQHHDAANALLNK